MISVFGGSVCSELWLREYRECHPLPQPSLTSTNLNSIRSQTRRSPSNILGKTWSRQASRTMTDNEILLYIINQNLYGFYFVWVFHLLWRRFNFRFMKPIHLKLCYIHILCGTHTYIRMVVFYSNSTIYILGSNVSYRIVFFFTQHVPVLEFLNILLLLCLCWNRI